MELLLSLVSFDTKTRATPLDVINSRFMSDLIEDDSVFYSEEDIVKSYTFYSSGMEDASTKGRAIERKPSRVAKHGRGRQSMTL